MSGPNKIHTVKVRLTPKDFRQLVRLSKKADVTRSVLVRRLILRAMPEWERMLDNDRLALL